MSSPSIDVTVEPVTIDPVTVDVSVQGLDNVGIGGTGTPLAVGAQATFGGTGTPVGVQLGGSGAPIEVGTTVGGTSTPVGVSVTAEAAVGGTATPVGVALGGITNPTTGKVTPVAVEADLTARLRELAPLFFNFLWKEIPFVKVALPHRYKLGFRFFNVEVFSISLCGESELITDKNVCAHEARPSHV